ncbi:unnamed protein product [Didymodactylos carnosus]|uniref:TRPM SLOG domain-containing protein n=1 Tax=Didymodactylos carnosus TaxID=1234261 RepID=A0A814C210_9BILA|nr:unnamed protein product [Didymodactylos carnosus]CAF3713017.1 unnamed protein product [Didymodactylos carnosus]
MFDIWNMKLPSLLLSITDGSRHFIKLQPALNDVFIRGVLKAAESTDGIPILTLVIEGGPNILRIVYSSVTAGIPCVFIEACQLIYLGPDLTSLMDIAFYQNRVDFVDVLLEIGIDLDNYLGRNDRLQLALVNVLDGNI